MSGHAAVERHACRCVHSVACHGLRQGVDRAGCDLSVAIEEDDCVLAPVQNIVNQVVPCPRLAALGDVMHADIGPPSCYLTGFGSGRVGRAIDEDMVKHVRPIQREGGEAGADPPFFLMGKDADGYAHDVSENPSPADRDRPGRAPQRLPLS